MIFSFFHLSNFLRSFLNSTIKQGNQEASIQANNIQGGSNSHIKNNDSKKWSDAERQMLVKAYRHYGEKWHTIAKCVGGRSATECKEEIKDFWVVEKFVNHRPSTESKGNWELRTRWVGWSSEDDTWEPINEKYEEVPDLVQQYIKSNPEVLRRKSSKRKRDDVVNMSSTKRVIEDHIFARCEREENAPWTDAELKTLVSMKDEGKAWNQIVKAVSEVGHGRSQAACKVTFFTLNEHDKECIKSGKSLNQVFRTWTNAELQVLILTREKEISRRKVSEAVSRA
jgi:hypothetical protein